MFAIVCPLDLMPSHRLGTFLTTAPSPAVSVGHTEVQAAIDAADVRAVPSHPTLSATSWAQNCGYLWIVFISVF